MIRENTISISRITRVADNALIIFCFFLAYWGREALLFWDEQFGWGLPFGGEVLAPIRRYYVVLFAGVIVFNLAWSALGAYDRNYIFNSWRVLRISILGSLAGFFAIASALFLMKMDLSRSVIILFCVLSAFGLWAERYLLRGFLRYWNSKGRNTRYVLIVGIGEQGKRVEREIEQRPELGLTLLGYGIFGADPRADELRSAGYGVYVGTEEIQEALKSFAVDEVIFTDIRSHLDEVENLVIICAEQGVRTTLYADLFSVGMAKSEVSFFGGIPLIHYETPPGESWELGVKRGIDLVVATITLILISPILLLIAVGIRIMSPGPVIFKQKRVGLNGRLFSMYKFRSMKVGAEKELQELIDRNEMDGPVFKLKNDPRVTPFGRFLRRFSLDELPQLFNVFRGDMSLVGPRPPIPGEVHQYERRYRRRLSMRPGITCIWQVSGRNEIRDFDTWMRLDLEYIDNWSLMRDLGILFRTIPAVLFGYGAR